MNGFVYFILCNGRVKIGRSKKPALRFNKLKSDAPYPCELLGCVSDDVWSEDSLHERFADFRVYGEWFEFSAPISAFVRDHAGEPTSGKPDRFHPDNVADDDTHWKRWRYSERLRQVDAAALIGVSPSFYNRLENGVSQPKPEKCIGYENVTGIDRHILRPDIFPEPEVAA